MAAKGRKPFGQILRDKRVARGISLRRFAGAVGVSPTYLSQVEQGNVDPPTAERVRKMAEVLGENADELTGLAGRLPDDLPGIIQRRPTHMPELLREANHLTLEQLERLVESAKRFRSKSA